MLEHPQPPRLRRQRMRLGSGLRFAHPPRRRWWWRWPGQALRRCRRCQWCRRHARATCSSGVGAERSGAAAMRLLKALADELGGRLVFLPAEDQALVDRARPTLGPLQGVRDDGRQRPRERMSRRPRPLSRTRRADGMRTMRRAEVCAAALVVLARSVMSTRLVGRLLAVARRTVPLAVTWIGAPWRLPMARGARRRPSPAILAGRLGPPRRLAPVAQPAPAAWAVAAWGHACH